jgi:hypothetical protein
MTSPKIDTILKTLPARSRIVAEARIALRTLPLADAEGPHFKAFLFRLAAIAWVAGKFYDEAEARLTRPAFADQRHTTQYASVPAVEEAQQFFRFIGGRGCHYACDNISQIAMAMAVSACEAALAAHSQYAGDPTLPRSPIFLEPVSWDPAVGHLVDEIRQADAKLLKMDTGLLATAPLWPNGTPEWAEVRWPQFRTSLPPDGGWDVWTAWYDDRLHGRVRDAGEEFAFASVPLTLWADHMTTEANRWIMDALHDNSVRKRPTAASDARDSS